MSNVRDIRTGQAPLTLQEVMEQNKDLKVEIIITYPDGSYTVSSNREDQQGIASSLYAGWHDWMMGEWG